MPNIYAYDDFRLFPKDHFADIRARKPTFSHRFLLMEMGITSSGFLGNILSEKRNLPMPM